MRRSAPGLAALVAALSLVLAGCTSDPDSIAAQAKAGDRKGYVAGDGTIETVAVSERSAPPAVSGTTLDGKAWSLRQDRDKVVVLNVWGSWCGPCVAEAPDLQKVWATMSAAGKPVRFMGLNYRDPSPETALAHVRKYRTTYPSLRDDGGRTLLSLRGKVTSTPTTLVLDRQGRVAARVSGTVSASTLTGLVDDVLSEGR